MSYYGAVRNGFQFAGWYPEDGLRQWQSCTSKLPKPDCIAYNDNNCTGQRAVPERENRYGGYSYRLVSGAPCDTIGVQTVEEIDMHIVELDWPDGDDPVASLIYGDIHVPLDCSDPVDLQRKFGLDLRVERRRHRERPRTGEGEDGVREHRPLTVGRRAGRVTSEGVEMSRSSRIGSTMVLAAALSWAGSGAAAAQEPAKLDAFAGGGLGISEGGAGFGVHVGSGVWATEHLRVGGLFYSGGALGLLSTHLRLPMDDNSDLLVGVTPLWIWPDQGAFLTPAVEAFISERASPLLRLEFGVTLDLTERGGYVQVLGRLVYSFD